MGRILNEPYAIPCENSHRLKVGKVLWGKKWLKPWYLIMLGDWYPEGDGRNEEETRVLEFPAGGGEEDQGPTGHYQLQHRPVSSLAEIPEC